ncbi:MAG: sensor histidine kinase, partial [Knoellia sp.]
MSGTTTAPTTPKHSWFDPGGWSLTTKLVAAVIGLFLVITAATSTFTVLALQNHLVNQIDQDVTQSLFRAGGPRGPGGGGGGAIPGGGGEYLLVVIRDGVVSINRVESGSTSGQLTTEQVATLQQASIGSTPKTVDVEGLGEYRVASARADGDTVISGLPMSGISRIVDAIIGLVVGTTIAGLALVALGGQWLIRRNLAPLSRVAHTATQVSRLELNSGAVALAQRVPAADTDPRTEVGQVGLALNNMLDNVEG